MSKILIVEDEVAIAELEKDYLELSGFDVVMQHTGDAGLKAMVSKSARRSVRRRIRRSSWYLPRRKISIRSVVWVWGLMII